MRSYLETCKNVLLAPVSFFKSLSITEGIRGALYFAVTIYYIRSIVFYCMSYYKGYFFNPAFKVVYPFSIFAAVFLAVTPFLLLLILYSQSIFVNRIGVFFGGTGNFEGAFKILAFVLFISLFMLIPFVGIAARAWAMIVLIIGIRYVFETDWISSILTLFFSYVFTVALYILVFGLPALFSKMTALKF